MRRITFVFSLYTDIFELQDFEPITHLCLSFPLHKENNHHQPQKRLMTYSGFLPHPGLNLVESRASLIHCLHKTVTVYFSNICKIFLKSFCVSSFNAQSFLIFFKIIILRTPNMRSAFLNAPSAKYTVINYKYNVVQQMRPRTFSHFV